ncbi:MAG: hypothetical protein EOO15_03010 [Chitinophagaceae bacterium]|nr:MAG: hypothetical protein EOO15_03010 [Chitinophagaceae bacterium]
MSRKEQLRKQFGLTPLQAEDYLKAWNAIRDLLTTFPTSQQMTSGGSDSHISGLLQALHNGSNTAKLTVQASALLSSSARTTGRLQQVVKRLEGIRDSYLWPFEVYPDAPEAPPANQAPLRFASSASGGVRRPKK